MNIQTQVAEAEVEIIKAKQAVKMAQMKLNNIQELCEHINVKSWTNDDGYGQFVVNRCLDCKLQKDGYLK